MADLQKEGEDGMTAESESLDSPEAQQRSSG